MESGCDRVGEDASTAALHLAQSDVDSEFGSYRGRRPNLNTKPSAISSPDACGDPAFADLSAPILHILSRGDLENSILSRPMHMDESTKTLTEALSVVKVQRVQLKRFLDTDRVMDALKCASTMLNELRASTLSPKHYYELYMAIFDALRHLSIYLHDAHSNGKHHLADLYELVQYCGNIVPRLYLMITVGGVYMSVPDAPVKEIMRDMIEMSRGIQHPTRGLFLRHYLSGATRDHLPSSTEPGPAGDLDDSIGFVLGNFVEMNKLWVRQQHLGHSRERERREMERRELRILVGTNLVRLSQLEGVSLDVYSSVILPRVLEQVVSCKDMIAQEHLMEVIVQVFLDEFHLHTLPQLLAACARLHPKVNVKQIVISLISRLAAYAAREAENESPEEIRRQEEEGARRLAIKTHEMQRTLPMPAHTVWQEIDAEQGRPKDRWTLFAEELGKVVPASVHGSIWHDMPPVKREEKGKDDAKQESAKQGDNHAVHRNADQETVSSAEKPEKDTEAQDQETVSSAEKPEKDTEAQDQETVSSATTAHRDTAPNADSAPQPDAPPSDTSRKFCGIPETVPLFEVFWDQILLLLNARADLTLADLAALLFALLDLCLHCYPDRLEYVDQILGFAHTKFAESSQASDRPAANSAHAQTLLLAPVNAYKNPLTLLVIPNFHVLWAEQPPLARRAVAQAIVQSMLQRHTRITTPEDAVGILELCASLIEEPEPQPSASESSSGQGIQQDFYPSAAIDELADRQGMLARVMHLFQAQEPEAQLRLLYIARHYLARGGDGIRYTFPALISAAIRLARKFRAYKEYDPQWDAHTATLFHFVHQLIAKLHRQVDAPELCVRFFLLAAEAADECGFEELAYEYYIQSFTLYEESISDSRSQLHAIGLIVSALFKTRIFCRENYDALTTRAAQYCSKLLKRPHQAAAVMMASHLWWQLPEAKGTVAKHALVHDGSRVIECLQKTLRIASGCMNENTTVEIFCHALNKYLYYFEQGVAEVTAEYIHSLIDLITKALLSLRENARSGASWGPDVYDSPASLDAIQQHFVSHLEYVRDKKQAVLGALAADDNVEVGGADWAGIEVHAPLRKLAAGSS
ncbi:Vps35p [Malassezia vespertilionis]|uniref:Vps35p n=1 Tax=Malassezia vespertilionis TaxID=2020962 RepID=A0A2N1JFR7_9BASI|nr:Vps35p [Malassezia vespertilionis]